MHDSVVLCCGNALSNKMAGQQVLSCLYKTLTLSADEVKERLTGICESIAQSFGVTEAREKKVNFFFFKLDFTV